MKNLVWIILAVVILAGGGFYLYSKNQTAMTQNPIDQTQVVTQTPASTDSTQATPAAEMTITYSDAGFTPASITIKIGNSVTWVNNSSKMMWVASNPHPQHTDLSGFDELKGVTKGESYTYTFTKAGDWGFHNHLSARDRGVVSVQ